MSKWKRFNELVTADLMNIKPPVSPHVTGTYGAIIGAFYFVFEMSGDWFVDNFLVFKFALIVAAGYNIAYVTHSIVAAAIEVNKKSDPD